MPILNQIKELICSS